MENRTLTLLRWVFMATGVGASALVLVIDDGLGALIFGILGLVFTSIGAGIYFAGWWQRRKEADLRANGQLVHAEFIKVEQNLQLAVNERHPWRIVAQWHDTARNRVHVFRSRNLWYDPSPYMDGRRLPVYIDLQDPSRHFMDVSFLPAQGA